MSAWHHTTRTRTHLSLGPHHYRYARQDHALVFLSIRRNNYVSSGFPELTRTYLKHYPTLLGGLSHLQLVLHSLSRISIRINKEPEALTECTTSQSPSQA